MKKTINLKSFTDAGTKKFRQLITTQPKTLFADLEQLSQDKDLTVDLGHKVDWDTAKRTRLDLAEALWPVLGVGSPLQKSADDSNVWNWIACHLFEEFHNSDLTQVRDISQEAARWIVSESILRAHRHLVLGPFTCLKNNLNDKTAASCLLVQDILEPGEVVERIAGKLELSRGSAVQVASWLYVDPAKAKIRSGITSEGTPQELSKYLNQIYLTVEYQEMSPQALLNMLPNKFAKWVGLAKKDYKIP